MSRSTRSPTPAPIHPRHLRGSHWTSSPGRLAHRHWEVIEWRKKRGEVVLRALLDAGALVEIPWRELRDRARWQPGLAQCGRGEEE